MNKIRLQVIEMVIKVVEEFYRKLYGSNDMQIKDPSMETEN